MGMSICRRIIRNRIAEGEDREWGDVMDSCTPRALSPEGFKERGLNNRVQTHKLARNTASTQSNGENHRYARISRPNVACNVEIDRYSPAN